MPLLQNMSVSSGMGGHYVLDEYGDRDVNFSIIYTSTVTGKVGYCCFFFKFNVILFTLLSNSV